MSGGRNGLGAGCGSGGLGGAGMTSEEIAKALAEIDSFKVMIQQTNQ